jgi:hypothetical protein
MTAATALADLKTLEDSVRTFQTTHVGGTDAHLVYRNSLQRILEELAGMRQQIEQNKNLGSNQTS